MHRNSYSILLLLFNVILRIDSIIFVNVWNACVDVSVEKNVFPISLTQSSAYYQVCPSEKQHWQRFGSSQFRMHILRTSVPLVDKHVELQHNGYVHLHNETRITVAKFYGSQHEEF